MRTWSFVVVVEGFSEDSFSLMDIPTFGLFKVKLANEPVHSSSSGNMCQVR